MARSGYISNEAPKPIGPYSHAVVIGNMVAAAGQAGIDADTDEIVSDDVSEQTQRTFENLSNTLGSAGASMDDVIHVRVFMADLADFEAMNAVYERHFSQPYPARTTVGAILPTGLKIEIDVLAVLEET